jgi:hypothetical protein
VSTTSWELRLIDRMSGPARGIARQLGRMRQMLGGAGGALGRFRDGLEAVGLSGGNIGWGTIAGGLANVGRSALGAGASLARAGVDLAAFREGQLMALETTLGSSEAALRSFNNAIAIANQTPLDTRDVVEMTQTFASGGFGEREMAPLLAASADLAAAYGRQSAESFSLVVSQMRSADRMDRGDLRQLLNSRVNNGMVLDSIARQLNIQGADERTRRNNVLRAITRGEVRGDVGIQAALDAISQRTDGGRALGTFALRQSQTLLGAISNARNAIDNLFFSFSMSETPGLQGISTMVLNITKLLSPANAAGQRLMRVFTTLSNGIFGGLSTDAKGASGALDRVLSGVEQVVPWILRAVAAGRAFTSGFGTGFMAALGPLSELLTQLSTDGNDNTETWRRFGAVLGAVAGFAVTGTVAIAGLAYGFYAAANGVAEWIVGLPARFEEWVTWFTALPGRMVDGFLSTITTEWARLIGTVEGLASQLPESVRSVLGIHSPSRVFAEIGLHTAAGLSQGIDAGAPSAQAAMLSLVAPPQGTEGAAAGRSMGPVSIVIQVQAGATPDETATATVSALEEELSALFSRLAESVP